MIIEIHCSLTEHFDENGTGRKVWSHSFDEPEWDIKNHRNDLGLVCASTTYEGIRKLAVPDTAKLWKAKNGKRYLTVGDNTYTATEAYFEGRAHSQGLHLMPMDNT
jgi:hypothetical protein